MRRQTSKPSMPGIMTSRRMMSGSCSSILASASIPLNAVTTSKYSAESFASSSLTLDRMSSTTRTLAVIGSADEPAHGIEEVRHRDGLRDIGLAATLANHLLIALHRKRGDGDNRYCLQGVVFLQPFRDF